MGKVTSSFVRDAAISAVIAVLAAVLVKFSDLPTRVSVIEADHASLKDAVKSMDGKLDILIQRTR
jgi:hypothetical protein